ncbi:MAG: YdcF family protein [Candidatus Omnitrophica bacterium]|nr:YdcF family protein [Candidatus Omnitrophota bacterium]
MRTFPRKLALVLACFALLGTTVYTLRHAADFLIVQDPVEHAELALVLSGDPVRRALAARDLYQQGRVDAILVIPEPPEPTEGELIRLGLLQPNLPSWPLRILAASGVPPAQVRVLPEPADGTITEARRVRAVLADHPPASLVLITSKTATRRARLIFRRVLSPLRIAVWAAPTPYDPFDPNRWWTRPRQALSVVMEYQKLASNMVTLALSARTP